MGGKMVKGMGGAMDLVSSGSRVVIAMEHVAKGNKHKILQECNLPLTGKKVVDRIITDLCVFDIKDGKMTLVEIGDGVSVDDVKAATGGEFSVADNLISMD